MLQSRLIASTQLFRSFASSVAQRPLVNAAAPFSTCARILSSKAMPPVVDLSQYESSRPRMSQSVKENETLAFVMKAMHHLAPLSLADKSWDNVGLLVEAPVPRPNAKGIILAIDLTAQVADEIINDKKDVSVVVLYHPIIFRGLKALTMSDPQQRSILRLIAEGVSIYCVHTAMDAVPGGLNDFLVTAAVMDTSILQDSMSGKALPGLAPIVPANDAEREAAGAGRVVTVDQLQNKGEPLTVTTLVKRMQGMVELGVTREDPQQLAGVKNIVQVARCEAHKVAPGSSEPSISTFAVCVGSGGSLFSKVQADVYITGELSHHEILGFTQRGSSVILLGHSNSERPYLSQVLHPRLARIIKDERLDYKVYVSEMDREALQSFA